MRGHLIFFVHGIPYRGHWETSRALGVTPRELRDHLVHGRALSELARSNSTPLAVRGLRFASAKACASYFRVSRQVVNFHLNKGQPDRIGAGNPEGAASGPLEASPIQVGPFRFVSVSATARRFKVHRNTVWRLAQKGRLDDLLSS